MDTGSMLIFAARYAHTRNTSAAFMVVRNIIDGWSDLSDNTRDTLIRESHEAIYNKEDWQMLRDFTF